MSLDYSPARAGDPPAGCPKGEGGKQALPEVDRIVGESECFQITNLSRTTRWRLMKQGLFPAKVALSPNRCGWRLSGVLQWVQDRESAA